MKDHTYVSQGVACASPPSSHLERGRLLEAFLARDISELGVSDASLLKLLAIGIETVSDLTKRTRRKFMQELKEFFSGSRKNRQKVKENDILKMVREVEGRFTEFGLEFARDKKKRIENLVEELGTLSLPVASPLSDEQASTVLGDQFPLFKKFREGTSLEEKLEARNAIIEANVGLARKWAHQSFSRIEKLREWSLDWEDLFHEGILGLFLAVQKYDYTFGVRLSTYATWWIRQSVNRVFQLCAPFPAYMTERVQNFWKQYAMCKKELERAPTREDMARALEVDVSKVEELMVAAQFWAQRSSLDEKVSPHEEESLSLGDMLDSGTKTPLEELEDEEAEQELFYKRILDEIPFTDVNRKCLEMYFGLNGEESHTLEEIGSFLGVTRERVRQRLAATLKRLRSPKIWEIAKEYYPNISLPSEKKPARWNLELAERFEESKRVRVVAEECELEETRTENDLLWERLKIINHVAEVYRVSPEEVLCGVGKPNASRARQVAMFLLREDLDLPFSHIADLFSCHASLATEAYRTVKSERVAGAIPLALFPSQKKISLEEEISE